MGGIKLARFWKFAKWVLIVFSLVMTVINIWSAITAKIAINWLSITALGPIFFAIYSESDWVYVNFNRIHSWVINNTVSFNSSFSIYTDKDINYSVINKRIESAMKACDLKFQSGSSRQMTSEFYRGYLKTKNNLKLSLIISNDPDEDNNILRVALDYQISSRIIKESWNDFKSFREFFVNGLATKKYRYDLTIDMTNTGLNPFYRLTLKSVNANNLENVYLKFKEENTEIEITKNKIHASSSEISRMDEIVEQYIPLTKVYWDQHLV